MASAESRDPGFCALATSLDPPTVLRKRGATRPHVPVRLRCGGGAAHGNHQQRPPYEQEREQASKHTRKVRAKGLCAPERSSTQAVHHCSARLPGCAHRDPVRLQARRLPSLSCGERYRDRTPRPVSTCHRPPGQAYAPRSLKPCPSRVFSLNGPETCGPQGGCGGPRRPLRRRPT